MLGLRTTIYKVADMNAAKKWYTAAFQTEPYFDEPFYIGFNIAGYELGLQPEEKSTTEKPDTVLTYWGGSRHQQRISTLVSIRSYDPRRAD